MIRNHYKLFTICFYLGIPDVYISSPTYSIKKGEKAVLQCYIHVNTNPVITSVWWTKQSGTAELHFQKSAEWYSGGNLKQPALTIFNTASSDSGIYNCYASNRKGQSYATAELIVGGKLS